MTTMSKAVATVGLAVAMVILPALSSFAGVAYSVSVGYSGGHHGYYRHHAPRYFSVSYSYCPPPVYYYRAPVVVVEQPVYTPPIYYYSGGYFYRY